jgi:hypothetical protein
MTAGPSRPAVPLGASDTHGPVHGLPGRCPLTATAGGRPPTASALAAANPRRQPDHALRLAAYRGRLDPWERSPDAP